MASLDLTFETIAHVTEFGHVIGLMTEKPRGRVSITIFDREV